MYQSVAKFGLLTLWLGLLVAVAMPSNTSRSDAAPLAVITGTPTELSTPTPTATATSAPTATPTRPPETGVADPAITKSVNVAEARIGDEIVFTLSVFNRGNLAANDVVVTDPFPEYLDVIEAVTTRGNISSVGRTVIIDIGKLGAGETVTITIRVRVNELAQPPEGRNRVTLVTSSPSDDPSNNTSETRFAIVGDPTPTATPPPPPATPEPPTPVPTPSKLPVTGGDGSSLLSVLALAGALAIGLSLLVKRFARR